ncbi:MAG: hypothetical protein P8R04_07085 [Gammaproteobacteria bacterium]|jgi:hypothetical protein|nr:hypothetical protein [Gammaproteobacteria bacterium]
MEFLKVALVVSLGLGVTWAADQVVPVIGSAEQAEIEKQLREIQETLGEDDAGELKDFIPSEPLSADLAIEFPSDI